MDIKAFIEEHFFKKEPLVVVDIGSNSVKLLEADMSEGVPRLVNLALVELKQEVFINNQIKETKVVAERIAKLLEVNGIEGKRVVTVVPGPAAFVKNIKVNNQSLRELDANVRYEAGSLIPYNMDDVKIDYHILGKVGKKLEVLVTVVKNEIVSSFLEAFMLAGVDVAIVDVDYFALQNCFELGYPELVENTMALVHMGARHTSVNICKDGKSLFVGNIPIGGNTFSDLLVEELDVTDKEAEEIKLGKNTEHESYNDALSLISVKIQEVASEFNRQLSLFWNASGSSEGIGAIMFTGGGSMLPGLMDAISEKTGLEVELLDPVRALDVDEEFDADYMNELSPFISLCAGLCMRQPGDKIVNNDD